MNITFQGCEEVAGIGKQLLPLASAAVGFIGALVLYYIKERRDLKTRQREALYFLCFFIQTMREMIRRGGEVKSSGAQFDEAVRKLAAAKERYFEWPEMTRLAEINSDWLAGCFLQMVHKQKILDELESHIAWVKALLANHGAARPA